MGYRNAARTAFLTKRGRRIIGQTAKGYNPSFHHRAAKVANRAKSYIKVGRDVATGVAGATAGAAQVGAGNPLGIVAAAEGGAKAIKAGKQLGKMVSRDLPSVRQAGRGAHRALKAGHATLKRRIADIGGASVTNPGGGKQPKISGDSLARLVRSSGGQ